MTACADGFLLVDKPAGVTSFRVVDHVRRELLRARPDLQPPRGRRGGGPRPPRFKCGHTGTLDPLATGLLVVLTGRASRLAPFLSGSGKTYAATVRFGTATDTLDREGRTTDTAAVPADPDPVAAALDGFRGEIMQVPPLVSALKRDGKPLYARVRAGEEPEAPAARPVRIDALVAEAWRWPEPESGHHEVDLTLTCSSGTYVRSLARDLALAAGTVGHLQALRRLAVGPFTVQAALTDILARDGGELLAALRPAADALPEAPAVTLTEAQVAAVGTGRQPEAAWLADPAPDPAAPLLRLLGPDGALVAVCRPTAAGPRLAAVFVAGPATKEPRPCD